MHTEIFDVEGNFGYRVIDEVRNILIEQPFKPNVEGFQPMTQIEAEQSAAEVMTAIMAEMTKPTEVIIP